MVDDKGIYFRFAIFLWVTVLEHFLVFSVRLSSCHVSAFLTGSAASLFFSKRDEPLQVHLHKAS